MQFSSCSLTFSLVLAIAQICPADDVTLIRVQTKDAKSYVGELISSENSETKLYDIELGREVTIPKSKILRSTSPLSDDDAARYAGLPVLVSWQISKLPMEDPTVGKIAKVSPTSIYFTLPKGTVKVGQKVNVFRKKGEILDPDTGKVLAVERPLVAKLEVTEVSDLFSKGKLEGKLETELLVGDEVETAGGGERRVAVCPLYMASGELTNVGVGLSEEITTLLVKKGVKVVERSAVSDVLSELVAQNTILFDAKSAQKIGQLTGATHVVVGKIVQNRRLGDVFVRLVNVSTGEITHAASSSVSLVNARVFDKLSDSANSEASRPLPATGAKMSSRGTEVSLTDAAPTNWILKKAVRGTKIWWDRDYFIRSISREISGGTLVIRSKGDEDEWLKPGTLSLKRSGTMFVVLRSHYLGEKMVNDVTVSQFERDGWKNIGEELKTTYPNGENWKWIVFKKEVNEGPVFVSLESVRWPNKVPALFIFK